LQPTLLLPRKKTGDELVADIAADSFSLASRALTYPQMPYRTFLAQAWTIIEPANPLKNEWYVDCLCEHLEAVTLGQIQKLLINLPPREGKSNIVTVGWPAWSWTRKAFLRFISCSYSASLSVKHSVMRRQIIESNWYQRQWGGLVKMAPDQNQKQEFENTARGHMIATSVGGTITGKGGDVEIEDDMINPLQAVSDAERNNALDMHTKVLSTRLDNPKTGARVIVEQRTHNQDVSGYALAHEQGYVHLNLPLIATKRTVIVFPLSGREVVREPDDILSPQRHGPAEVADLRRTMTEEVFQAQCQQDPSSDVGNILKRHYWKRYTELPTGFDVLVSSWDMTFKETQKGSFVGGHVWGKRGPKFYLFPIRVKRRMDFSQTLIVFEEFLKTIEADYKFKPTGHLVEDKANGPAVISTMQQKIAGIMPMPTVGSKIARAQAMAPLIRAGDVLLPDDKICVRYPEFDEYFGGPWVLDFIEESAKFKGAATEINDQVDTTSQALIYLHNLVTFAPNEDDDEEMTFIENGVDRFGGSHG
jgi:hypothetical protein